MQSQSKSQEVMLQILSNLLQSLESQKTQNIPENIEGNEQIWKIDTI